MRQPIFILPLVLGMLALAGCSVLPRFDEVLPDKRTEYRKSQSMPDLEVPPDLTAEAINDSMAIPNEQAATLSRYRRQQAAAPAAAATAAVQAGGDQQWLSVAAGPAEIWPVLRDFFTSRGYTIEVADAELGVLETGWSQPVNEGGLERRTKFKIFSEPGADPGSTLLVISGTLAERMPSAGGDGEWLERSAGAAAEQQVAQALGTRLNQAFAAAPDMARASAATASVGAVPSAAGRARAELRNDQDGRIYLAIPEEFTGAWRLTGEALQRAGVNIEGRDPARGLYQVTYFPAPGEEKEGWLSKLAFWKGDEPEGRMYAISLTGQGETTELIVLNEEGDWETNQDAGRILGLIQNEYNSR